MDYFVPMNYLCMPICNQSALFISLFELMFYGLMFYACYYLNLWECFVGYIRLYIYGMATVKKTLLAVVGFFVNIYEFYLYKNFNQYLDIDSDIIISEKIYKILDKNFGDAKICIFLHLYTLALFRSNLLKSNLNLYIFKIVCPKIYPLKISYLKSIFVENCPEKIGTIYTDQTIILRHVLNLTKLFGVLCTCYCRCHTYDSRMRTIFVVKHVYLIMHKNVDKNFNKNITKIFLKNFDKCFIRKFHKNLNKNSDIIKSFNKNSKIFFDKSFNKISHPKFNRKIDTIFDKFNTLKNHPFIFYVAHLDLYI